MNQSAPSFIRTSLVVLVIIVFPLLVATGTAVLVKDWLTVALTLLYSLTLLLIVVPYFALVTDQVSSNVWLKTYIQVLDKILPVVRPSLLLQRKHPSILLEAVVEKRICATHWKCLHEDCQKISHQLIILRRMIRSCDLKTLGNLEDHWRMDCSNQILRLTQHHILPLDSGVKDQFAESKECTRWLAALQSEADKLDGYVDMCGATRNVILLREHLPKIRRLLDDLELNTSHILIYVDGELKKTIYELDRKIEDARRV